MLRRVQVARSRLEDAMYIEVKDLKKSYGTGDSKVQVLVARNFIPFFSLCQFIPLQQTVHLS